MRVALAQIDVTVGAVDANARMVVEYAAAGAAGGADLVVFPELALSGYPPEDLLARGGFLKRCDEALVRLAAEVAVPVVVGTVTRGTGGLYNSLAYCAAGRVERLYHKRLLPNYGVFDEERYFEPGAEDVVLAVGGLAVALTVCEDVWDPATSERLAGAGAQLIINASASPFHAGKAAEREAMLALQARANGIAIAYCNLVGGQDELVFDGGSFAVQADGTAVARARSFAEDLLFVDFGDEAPIGRLEDVRVDAAADYEALVLGLADYARKNGFTDLVLGLSGGIDSALTAAIAADALGPERVHGVLMPSRYSSEGSVTDAHALADALGIETIELPIERPYAAFLDTLAPGFVHGEPTLVEENVQARIRGALLMALSNEHGWLVLATGNKSELSVGYSTLYGDMVGGFAPIKDVLKTRVYALARWRNGRGAVIPHGSLTKAPSAELRPGQTDQDSLPPYDVLDAILAAYIERDASGDEIIAAGHDADLVRRVIRMVDAAEYKRRQGAIGTKITPKAFGKDRRMPITNGYRE